MDGLSFAGLLSPLAVDSLPALSLFSLLPGVVLVAAGVFLRLSVMYQPEPLKITPTGCSTRRVSPPQLGQTRIGSSLIDCNFSKRWRQARHSYS